jgi:flavin reductase (DIM6/NTAB) family NADH-FMN oxidoreductase RutF
MFSWASIASDEVLAVDPRTLRRALGSFPTGVCIVTTTGAGGKREGMTINSFASVSLDPPFVINVLGAQHAALAAHFARPAPDKFADHDARFSAGASGLPVLLDAIATYECTTYSRYQEGDHVVLIGRVDHLTHHEAPPLVFHAGKLGSLQELAEHAS